MKKQAVAMLLAAAMILGLCACGKKETEVTPPPSTEPTATATPTPTPAPTPIVFPTNVERTFSGMMGIDDIETKTPQDAICYDALCYYYRRYDGGEHVCTGHAGRRHLHRRGR